MISRWSTSIALVLGLLGGPASAQSNTSFTLCTEGDAALSVAMLEHWYLFFTPNWEVSGWYRIERGDCRTWRRLNRNTQFLLSVRSEFQGDWLIHPPLDAEPPPEFLRSSGVYDVEQFLCVREGTFKRAAPSRSAFDTCRGDEFKQLFNIFVFVEHGRQFTLTLN